MPLLSQVRQPPQTSHGHFLKKKSFVHGLLKMGIPVALSSMVGVGVLSKMFPSASAPSEIELLTRSSVRLGNERDLLANIPELRLPSYLRVEPPPLSTGHAFEHMVDDSLRHASTEIELSPVLRHPESLLTPEEIHLVRQRYPIVQRHPFLSQIERRDLPYRIFQLLEEKEPALVAYLFQPNYALHPLGGTLSEYGDPRNFDILTEMGFFSVEDISTRMIQSRIPQGWTETYLKSNARRILRQSYLRNQTTLQNLYSDMTQLTYDPIFRTRSIDLDQWMSDSLTRHATDPFFQTLRRGPHVPLSDRIQSLTLANNPRHVLGSLGRAA